MGDTGMTPKHRDVVDKLRERLEQYRKHHVNCQTKQDRMQGIREEQERQDAALLHKRAIDSRAKMLSKAAKQQDAKSVPPEQHNGLEMKTTTAILQKQILKRKFDQGLNNSPNIRNCDQENGQGGESLSKYQRGDDLCLTGMQSHELNMNLTSSQHSVTSAQQLDSIESFSNLGAGRHYDGASPLLSSAGVGSDIPYNTSNRVQSPNTLQTPTEFKQEDRQITVSCEGGRLSAPGAPHESLCNGVAIANSSRDNGSNGAFAGQELLLQQEIKDFDDVLRKYTDSSYKGSAGQISSTEISPQQHRQLQRPGQPGSMDTVTRETRTAQQSPTLPPVPQKHQFPTVQQAPTGPTALHLQQLARHAQRTRGYMDGQEQDTTNLNQFSVQSMQFFNRMPSQGAMPQVTSAGRFRMPVQTGPDQYASVYSKDQNRQGIMSTGFPSNAASVEYQRMIQSQVSQQQAMYNRLNQQPSMPQRLSHPTIPEQQPYQQYSTQQSMVQQVNTMSLQNLPAYSTSGYTTMRANQSQFQRQHSMPLMPQGYPTHDQYAQQMQQYQVSDQQSPTQPHGDMNPAASYTYSRRNSFPLYHHHTLSQPAGGYAQSAHNGYNGPLPQMSNALHRQNPGMMEGRGNASSGYSYNVRTQAMTAQPGNQPMVYLQGQQRTNSVMAAVTRAAGVQMQQHSDQTNMGYVSADMRDMNTQPATQDMKYNNRTDVPRTLPGYTASTMALPEPNTASVSARDNDSQFSAFSPLAALEKAPSFTSLLEQSSGNLTNLETTYTGSIPNLDLLGEIIG